MGDQIRSAALLIDLKMDVTEKLLKSAICAAQIEFDDSQGQWEYYKQTPLGYKLRFDISASSPNESKRSITLDVVLTQTDDGTVVLANYQADHDMSASLLNEIHLKTQTVIETTMPVIKQA